MPAPARPAARLSAALLTAPLVGGCGGKEGALVVSPAELAWGEVDFQREMPEGGHDPLELTITNDSESEVELKLAAFDFDRLCLPGFTAAPATITSLDAGGSYLLRVGVCGYSAEAGERDTEVRGELVFTADGAVDGVAPWSFTPVEDLGGDDTAR
jgi:hypothetical protein